MQILLSRTQAGPGRTGKQEQEQISRNHVQILKPISVHYYKKSFQNSRANSSPTSYSHEDALLGSLEMAEDNARPDEIHLDT